MNARLEEETLLGLLDITPVCQIGDTRKAAVAAVARCCGRTALLCDKHWFAGRARVVRHLAEGGWLECNSCGDIATTFDAAFRVVTI